MWWSARVQRKATPVQPAFQGVGSLLTHTASLLPTVHLEEGLSWELHYFVLYDLLLCVVQLTLLLMAC